MAFPRPFARQLRGRNGNLSPQINFFEHALGSRRRRVESVTRRARSKVDEVDGDPSPPPTTSTSTRRRTLLAAPLLSLSLLPAPSAVASTVPALDGVWFSVTGAPPDLYFPASSFLGEFEAVSTLVSAEAPLGEGALAPASLAGLRRAREEDLNRPLRYVTRFVPAPEGNPVTPPNACVFDRAYNTLSLLRATSPQAARGAKIEWDVNDPNLLSLKFDAEEAEEGEAEEEGQPRRRRRQRRSSVRIRVTKRSEKAVAADRLDTSEFTQMIFLNDGESESGVPRVKASQVFSKWRWRAAAEDEGGSGSGSVVVVGGGRGGGESRGQPTVVATQVVSEFLSVEAGGERAYLESAGRPVAVYTYRLALTRV